MATSTVERALHVRAAIANIRTILGGHTFQTAQADLAVWPAFERYLEIISEASRGIPADWKLQFGPQIAWRDIAAIGNLLRHVYERTEAGVFWDIYLNDLDPLEAAIDRMIAANPIS